MKVTASVAAAVFRFSLQGARQTVYTLRLATSCDRGAALDDYNAGILVCLVGQDGDAFLHRIQPLADPESRRQELQDVCTGLDGGGGTAGANCRLALNKVAAAVAAGSADSPAQRRRFQEGSVDEVCFLGPELGPLAGLLVAPEGGRWALHEVDVASSASGLSSRFICRGPLGGRDGTPAAFLAPVPEGAVVYGSGEAALVLSADEAAQVCARGAVQSAPMLG